MDAAVASLLLRIFVSASSSAMSWGCGAPLSRRARRRGRGLVMDFCFSFLAVPRRRFLRRCWEEGDWCVGAVAVVPLRLAADWWMPWPVQGLWSTAVGSGAAPRRRRLGRPDLEVEGELGARPRPARHRDMWAFVLLLGFTKPFGDGASSSSGMVASVSSSCGAPASAASGGMVLVVQLTLGFAM